MGSGYVADEAGIAARIGELNAVASEVDGVLGVLGATGCDLGPGDLSAAVAEAMEQWRSNLGDMRDKIDDAAGNVRDALTNYQLLEDSAESELRAAANQTVTDQQLDLLRGAAAGTLAEERRTAK